MPRLSRRQPQDLPQRQETWHVFSFRMRTWVMEKNLPMRPYGLMVMDLGSHFMVALEMTLTFTPEWVSQTLFKAITHPSQGMPPHRPETITLPGDDLVAALTPQLAEIGVACRQMDTPGDLYHIVADLNEHMSQGRPEIAGLLSIEGVTPRFAKDLFAAALEFYQAAPWVQLTNSQALAVRLSSEPDPRYVSVMGNAGIEYGLSVSRSWEDFRRLASGAVEEPLDFIPEQGGHSLLFNAKTMVSFDDLDALEEHHWPVPDENAIPFPMVFDRQGRISRPDRAELLWYQAALRAIPIFVRDHLRSDRAGDYRPAEASIVVPTSDGDFAVVIRYPAGELDLASEPAAQMDWDESEDQDAGALVFDRRMLEGRLAAAGPFGGQSFLDDPQLRRAQEMMYEAWEAGSPARRISLAHKALTLSPDCADAYVLLAEEQADTVGRALELYQQGVAAGERALGPHFANLEGEFWGVLETRPYMRARLGLANTLWRLRRRDEARAQFEDMLRLNPGDNQGVRYLLINLLFEMEREADVPQVLNRYRGDASAVWRYTQALLAFRQAGATDKANRALRQALRQNSHVPSYLTGQKRLPNRAPDYVGMGDENEAIAYASEYLNYWRKTEGAVDWLKEQLVEPAAPAASGAGKAPGSSFDAIVEALVAEMAGPLPLDELVKRVLERKPSQAANPARFVARKLRQHYGPVPYVFVDRDTMTPLRLAMQGVRFRITLDRQMAGACVIPLDPYFFPFLRGVRAFKASVEFSFVNDQGDEIPAELNQARITGPEGLGRSLDVNAPAIDFKAWLGPLRPRRGDSLLFTVLDWERGHFQVVYEPERRQRKQEIAAQNRALADKVYELLEETYDERLQVQTGLPTAYARLASARDYPGDQWLAVVERDERLAYTGLEIIHADSDRGSLFDQFAQEPGEDAVQEKSFTAHQGRQVYRFRAARGRKEFIIELTGESTLGNLDAVMKEAFKLDTWDHLSEFTLITPRGKGKQPRRKPLGSMDPLGEYAAHHVRLAGLGLEQGALLEYLYDFGDNIEHSLVLEAVEEPESGTEYPRFHKVAGRARK